ncbi:MAG: potassium transporter TrkG [Pseudomonadota bacterium]
MTNVLNVYSVLLWLFGSAMILPAIAGITTDDLNATIDFVIVVVLTVFVAGSIMFAVRERARAMNRVESYILLVVTWVSLPAVGAVPLTAQTELTALDAYLEAVSALTTTGFTVLQPLDEASRAVLFWRAEMQWIGGLLTLWSLVLIIAPFGVGGLLQSQISLMSGATGREVTNSSRVALDVARLYGVLTLFCAVGLLVFGVPLFDAICLAFSTVSTGGMMPRDGNLDVYASPGAQVVIVMFMLAGATSIFWFRMMQSRWQMLAAHRESYLVIGAALTLGLAYAVLLFQAAGSVDVLHPLTALREGILTGTSLVTTTGFEVRQSGFSVLPMPIVLFVVLVGAGSFSTAGGVKFYRIGAMLVQAGRELSRLIYPHSVRPAKFGAQNYDIQLMKAIWAFFLTVVIFVPAVGVMLASPDLPMDGALLASASAFANAGPVYASGWLPGAEQWPEIAAFSTSGKVVLCATMILGRLEILALFGALNRTYWFNR